MSSMKQRGIRVNRAAWRYFLMRTEKVCDVVGIADALCLPGTGIE